MVRVILLLLLALPAYAQVAPFVFAPSGAAGSDTEIDIVDSSESTLSYGWQGSHSWSHITSAGDNRLLLVAWASLANGEKPGTATYNGDAMTFVDSISINNGVTYTMYVYRLVAPDVGTADIAFTWTDGNTAALGLAVGLNGVDATTPLNGIMDTLNTSRDVSWGWDVVSAVGDTAAGFVFDDEQTSYDDPIPGTGDVVFARINNGANGLSFIATPGAASSSLSVTHSNNTFFSIVGFNIKRNAP